MMLHNLIPKIFYERLEDGLDFFVDAPGFRIDYRDAMLAVVSRDGAKAQLVEDPASAARKRPELAIDTDDVDAVYREMAARAPQPLHPNAGRVAPRPWGSREFAMLDPTTVCVNFRQWPEAPRAD